MTDDNTEIDEIETKDIDVFAFRCGTCGARAVPTDGYDTGCHKAECDGHFTEKTGEVYTITVSVEQYELYADSVIAH